jgi:hypothetical protein
MSMSTYGEARKRLKDFGSGSKVNLGTKSVTRSFFAVARSFVAAKHS